MRALRWYLLCLVSAALLVGCLSTPPGESRPVAVPGASTGSIEGAPFRIAIPPDWNGDLVLYLHGYEPSGRKRQAQMAGGRMEDWALSRGYAMAQSAYSTQGWAVAEALVDNERLRQHFIDLHGEPRRTLLIGHSMGGHLVLASMERYPQAHDGGLSLCGANSPAAELFADGLVPPLVAFDHFFPGAMGLAPAGLSDPNSPPMVDPEALELALRGNETQARALSERFAIQREDLAGALMFRYFILRELMQRAGGFPVDTRAVVYTGMGDDAAFNAGVRRHTGDPAAMAYAAANAPLLGTIRAPVVLLANAYDPTVPAAFSSRYVALAKAAGNGDGVIELASVGHGHCAFDPADVDRAFDALLEQLDKRPL
jgi:pimeloyl-ACP methyl ester carboxylesterase